MEQDEIKSGSTIKVLLWLSRQEIMKSWEPEGDDGHHNDLGSRVRLKIRKNIETTGKICPQMVGLRNSVSSAAVLGRTPALC